jgi:hypothetical protein
VALTLLVLMWSTRDAPGADRGLVLSCGRVLPHRVAHRLSVIASTFSMDLRSRAGPGASSQR